MTTADFEDRYRRDPDPWDYAHSAYEQAKYDATLRACGPGPFARALELGSSIGVLSARLAARCEQLVTIDAAPSAVAAARRRLDGLTGVDVRLGTIPDAVVDGPYALVLCSEILYYLQPAALETTLQRIAAVTATGARVVAVHWRPAGPERPFTAVEVHARLRGCPWLSSVDAGGTDDYLLDVFTRR